MSDTAFPQKAASSDESESDMSHRHADFLIQHSALTIDAHLHLGVTAAEYD